MVGGWLVGALDTCWVRAHARWMNWRVNGHYACTHACMQMCAHARIWWRLRMVPPAHGGACACIQFCMHPHMLTSWCLRMVVLAHAWWCLRKHDGTCTCMVALAHVGACTCMTAHAHACWRLHMHATHAQWRLQMHACGRTVPSIVRASY